MTAYPILPTHEQCTVQEIRSILIAPPQASEAKQKLSPPACPRGKLNAQTRQRESGFGALRDHVPTGLLQGKPQSQNRHYRQRNPAYG
jgi:hypothetical protein